MYFKANGWAIRLLAAYALCIPMSVWEFSSFVLYSRSHSLGSLVARLIFTPYFFLCLLIMSSIKTATMATNINGDWRVVYRMWIMFIFCTRTSNKNGVPRCSMAPNDSHRNENRCRMADYHLVAINEFNIQFGFTEAWMTNANVSPRRREREREGEQNYVCDALTNGHKSSI